MGAMGFWNRSKNEQQTPEPQTKRISTPAGQRLSVILENGASQGKPRDTHRTSVRKSGLSAAIADAPRESLEHDSQNSSGYSFSVWSDGEKFSRLKNHKQVAKRGGWKRLVLIVFLVIACIIGLAVGLAVGLKKKSSSDSSAKSDASNNNNNDDAQPAADPTNPSSAPSSTSAATTKPSGFPLGTYSFVVFLDTIRANCTSDPSTWTCYPYTEYNISPDKSLAVFNWKITGSESAYKISSTDNPFAISFKNAELELMDEGEDSERYRFQISQTKTVRPRDDLAEDDVDGPVECDYDNTNLQAYLYTKMEKTFPDETTIDGDPSYDTWPYAVRVEQAIGGGEGVPSCYQVSNGDRGDQISIDAEDAGNLCSCLYKNWRTPTD